MKAWVLHGANDIRFEDSPKPLPEKGEALVKVKAAGICGSDIPRVFATGAHRHPLIIGHEFSGVVEGIGRGVSAAWLGRRVGVFPLLPCRECMPCRQGQYELCRAYDYLGSRRDGGFAEYAAVPAGNLIGLPGSVSFEEAAMLEPMAVAVHAMRRGTGDFGLPRDATAAICGFGTIGILTAMLLADAGYRNLYIIGNKDFQKRKAVSLGIPPGHYYDNSKKPCNGNKKADVAAWLQECAGGADIFFECTGREPVLSWGVDSAKPGGRVVLVGNPCSDMRLARDTYWKILRNQLTMVGTWNSSFTGDDADDWHYALKRLEMRSMAPAELVTHRLPLERLQEGLTIMHDRTEEYCKIMVLEDGW